MKIAYLHKWFLLNSFWGNVLLGGELQIDAKMESNFDFFEKSGSVPLNMNLGSNVLTAKGSLFMEKNWRVNPSEDPMPF